jgi:hypothetical protein
MRRSEQENFVLIVCTVCLSVHRGQFPTYLFDIDAVCADLSGRSTILLCSEDIITTRSDEDKDHDDERQSEKGIDRIIVLYGITQHQHH